MELHLTLPTNVLIDSLMQQERIPCVCRIDQEIEIRFQEPLPVGRGIVKDWDWRSIADRVPAVMGEPYTHHVFGLLSLEPSGVGCYRIVELAVFDRYVGWCPVIENGSYGPVGRFWDEEEQDREVPPA